MLPELTSAAVSRYRVEMTFEVEGTDDQIREAIMNGVSHMKLDPASPMDTADVVSMLWSMPLDGSLFMTIGGLQMEKMLEALLEPVSVRTASPSIKVTVAEG